MDVWGYSTRYVFGKAPKFCNIKRPNPWTRSADTPPELTEGPIMGTRGEAPPVEPRPVARRIILQPLEDGPTARKLR